MRKICLLLAIFLLSAVSVAAADFGDVVINEVAWMGTDASTADEWIELFNTTDAEINLTDWILAATDGTPEIIFEQDAFEQDAVIAARGFFLLERSNDDNTISDITADQTFTGALENKDEVLILRDAAGILIDKVGASGNWYAGNNTSKASMERVDPTADGTIAENWADNNGEVVNGKDADEMPLRATPREQNSVYSPPDPPSENQPPDLPTELSPENGTFTNSRELSAVFSDGDSDSGTLEFRIFATEPIDCSLDGATEGSVEVNSGDRGSWQSETEIDDGEYFWCARAFDDKNAESDFSEVQTFTLDTVAPTFPDSSTLTAEEGDSEISLAWAAANDEIEKYLLRIDGGDSENLGNVLEFQKTGLENGVEYLFEIFAVDSAGNESAAISTTAMPSETQTFPAAASGEVVINEVAWAGSTSSTADEWIELKNTTSNKIFDLSGWQILTDDGVPEIVLAGELQPGGFFLLERTDDDSVPEISADQIYTGSLSNSGEILTLLDSENSEIDRVDGSNSWEIGGDNNSKKTLARTSDGNYQASFEIDGTPKAANFLDHDLAVSEISASPAAPLPNEEVVFTAEIENRGLNSADFKIIWEVAGDEVFSETTENLSLVSFGSTTETFSRTFAEGTFEIFATVEFSDDENPANDSKSLENFEVENHLVISEFVPNPAGLDSENEWIELFNPTESLIEFADFELNGTSISGSIEPNGFFVLENFDGLKNSSDRVILKNSDGEIVDSKSYSNAVEKKSFGRDSENLNLWREFWHPTRGAANIFPEANEPPVARITIQGSGNSSGSCSLFVNLIAEDSTDSDGDDLEFSWDFGNGETSDEENPGGFYFSPENYTVTLTVTDVLDAESEASQTFTVSGCSSGGGGGGSTTKSSEKEKTDEPVFTSISASRVELKITEVSFNSAADWIEIQLLDDGNSGNGIDLGGFYFEVDKRIKTIPKNTKMKTGEFLLLTFKSTEKDSPKSEEGVWKIYSEKSGLTKTDEQITLRDSAGTIEDAVAWENRNGKWSRGEDIDIAEIVENGGWISAELSDAVDSSSIEREIVIARFPNSADTNSAADWFATPFATSGKENSAPPVSASEIEFLISEVAPKNLGDDRVKLICRDCGSTAKNLAGFFLEFGGNKIFEFPAEFEISSGETVEIIFGAAEESFSENVFHSTFRGLVGSDGLLSLADFANETADFVGWSNRAAPPNREHDLLLAELIRLEKQFADGQWDSELPKNLLDSRELPRGGSFLRKNSADTNSAVDFEIREPAEPLLEIQKMTGEIRLSEILPNPRGPDSAAEWFELANFGSQPVELFGWQVFVGNGSHEFEESVLLEPNEFRAFPGLLPIRNSGGIFTILNADGETVDAVEYPEIRESQSFARNLKNEFSETEIPTPNSANSFYQILAAAEDFDGDGLSNSREAEFGTDPEKFDSDGDSLSDFFEIQNSTDPNSFDCSPKNLRKYRAELAALADSRLEHSVDEKNGVFLAGVGVPGGRMRLYIHSELSIVEIPIAENGSWSYTLDQSLAAGRHDIFTQLVDPAGVEGVARKVLNFNFVEKFTPPVFTENIRISEILPNPIGSDAENEFIELENFGSEPADLSNFRLVVGRKKFTFPENSAIPTGEFLALARAESGLTLPNSGGLISLAWPTGRLVAEFSYEKVREGVALAFDGSEFCETKISTPAAANKISAPEARFSKKKLKKVPKNRNGDLSTAIQISEILANPIEKDSAGEWIEIWNSGSTAVNLGNWRLDDSAGGSRPFTISDSTILRPGEFKIFPRPLTKIALNNSGGEAARLFDFAGRLISEINFDSPLEGIALAFDGSEFRETKISTPNFANEFDSQKIEGTIRFAGKEGFVIENSSGEFFVKFEEGNSALLARALLREGARWKIFVENSGGNFTLKNFAAVPKLLRSQLLSSINSPPLESQNSAWIFALLVFAAVFLLLRFVKIGAVWDSQN